MKLNSTLRLSLATAATLFYSGSLPAAPIVQTFDVPVTTDINLDFDLTGGADHRLYSISSIPDNRTFGDIGFSQTTGSFNSWRSDPSSNVNFPGECCSIGVVFTNAAGTDGTLFTNVPGLNNSAFVYIPVKTTGFRGFAEFVVGAGGVAHLARSGMIENSFGSVLSPQDVGLPEPASLALLGVGGVYLISRRRHVVS